MFDHGLTDVETVKLDSRSFRRDSKGQALDYLDLPRHKMSDFYFPPATSTTEDDSLNISSNYVYHTSQSQPYSNYTSQFSDSTMPQQHFYTAPSQYSPQPQHYQQLPSHQYQQQHQQAWTQPTVPSNYPFPPQDPIPFPPYQPIEEAAVAGPSRLSTGYLSPDPTGRTRPSRSTSQASNASSAQSGISWSDVSRSVSPNASEMAKWGSRNEDGSWSCAYPGCSSRSTFNRGCDLRKHYKRHTKSLFCRHDGCPQSVEGGFSSKKDRARHEAKHNPSIVCEWDGCERLFSRQDNMKDHVRRVHKRRIA